MSYQFILLLCWIFFISWSCRNSNSVGSNQNNDKDDSAILTAEEYDAWLRLPPIDPEALIISEDETTNSPECQGLTIEDIKQIFSKDIKQDILTEKGFILFDISADQGAESHLEVDGDDDLTYGKCRYGENRGDYRIKILTEHHRGGHVIYRTSNGEEYNAFKKTLDEKGEIISKDRGVYRYKGLVWDLDDGIVGYYAGHGDRRFYSLMVRDTD